MKTRFIKIHFPKEEREVKCLKFIEFEYQNKDYFALLFLSTLGNLKLAHLIIEDDKIVLKPFKSIDEEAKFKSRCKTSSLYSFKYKELPLSMLPDNIELCVNKEKQKSLNIINNLLTEMQQTNYKNIPFYEFFHLDNNKLPLEEFLKEESYINLDKALKTENINLLSKDKQLEYLNLLEYYNAFKQFVLSSNSNKKMYDMCIM